MTLSFGYFTGVLFIKHTTEFSAQGIEESYNGNEQVVELEEDWEEDEWSDDWEEEQDEAVESLKFKRSEREIISTIHSHVIIFALIFLAMGTILSLTSIPMGVKKFLMIEPFVSIVLTFGGIWLLWKDITWMKYVVMISGMLMTTVFTLSALVICWQLVKKK